MNSIILIVFLPLLAAIVAGFGNRIIGNVPAKIVTTGALFASCALSWPVFIEFLASSRSAEVVPVMTWIVSGDLNFDWSLRVDALTAVMLVVVTTVSALVHLYSWGYMDEDPDQPRFFAYLSLFTFAMLMLVTANNLVQMFFGWEGVGLASYLLIGFWFKKPSANAAAIKAFVVNRVGDLGFMLGIFGTFLVFGTVSIPEILEAAPGMAGSTITFAGMRLDTMTILCLLLFIGAMGKSAQLGLHTWLPDAMEGPTPVSALIHAATMVTAGVFLVCRCSVIYEYAPNAAAMVTFVGAITAFFAATVGLLQDDIKKIVAYSTCSQLGYMFFAAGVGAYNAAMFHLFTHAFFKALLFLGSGAVIHGMHHEQDIKKMGGVKDLLPMTHILMVIGTIAITGVGIPGAFLFGAPVGTAGFVSKDMILESAFAAGEAGRAFGGFAFLLGLLAAIMTAFYSWRLIALTFWGKSRAPEHVRKHPHAVPDTMMWPLIPLAVGALVAGMAFYGSFVDPVKSPAFWNGALYSAEAHGDETHGVEDAHGEAAEHAPAADAHAVAEADEHGGGHHAPTWVLWAPFVAMLLGSGLAFMHYGRGDPLRPGLLRPGGMIYAFLKNKWYFDEIYDFLLVKPALAIGRFLWKEGDGKTIDGVGPDGIAATVAAGARRIVRVQTGYMYHYAFAMLIGIALFVTFMLFRAGGGQ